MQTFLAPARLDSNAASSSFEDKESNAMAIKGDPQLYICENKKCLLPCTQRTFVTLLCPRCRGRILKKIGCVSDPQTSTYTTD